jgi:hypothetical protein
VLAEIGLATERLQKTLDPPLKVCDRVGPFNTVNLGVRSPALPARHGEELRMSATTRGVTVAAFAAAMTITGHGGQRILAYTSIDFPEAVLTNAQGRIHRRSRLGGLLDYHERAASCERPSTGIVSAE